MIIGHAVQFGSHDEFDFFTNPAFVVIYAFHMPLFALMSGYLAYGSFKRRTEIAVLRDRLRGVLLPFAMWTIVAGGARLFLDGARTPADLIDGIGDLFLYPMRTIWFLWFVLLATLLLAAALLCRRFLGRAAVLLSIVVPFLVPIEERFAFHQLRWLYPFIVVGFLLHEHKAAVRRFADPRLAILAALVFAAGLVFWERDYSVYLSQGIGLGGSVAHDVGVWALRYVIAFAGCAAVIGAVKAASDRWALGLLRDLGIASLGIYCVQTYLVALLPKAPTVADRTVLFFAVYVPVVTVLLLAVSYLVTRLLLERVPLLRLLFLGGRAPAKLPATSDGSARPRG